MGNDKSKECFIFDVHVFFLEIRIEWKCNVFKALSERIDSVSADDVNTIMESMQGIIDEGSDHIKDLELKIKSQGKGWNIKYFVYPNYSA